MAKISRRKFLKFGGIAFSGKFGIATLLGQAKKGTNEKPQKSKVVIVRDDKLREGSNGKINTEILEQLLDLGIRRLTGKKDFKVAWRSIFNPSDVVGIKVNCIAGKSLSTSKELVELVIKKLIKVGVKGSQLIIWDRNLSELIECGFIASDVRILGAKEVGFDDNKTKVGSIATKFTKILQECTKIINMPILKTHWRCGVSVALKNHLGSINNPNKFHQDYCNPYIADLNAATIIAERTKLIICDAISPLYNHGPQDNPKYRWNYNGLILSFDPVALDYVGWQIIEARRKLDGLPKLLPPPTYILTAADEHHRLGYCEPKKINIIEVYNK